MPTPSTTTWSSLMGRSAPPSRPSGQGCAALPVTHASHRLPLPHGAHRVAVVIERLDDELHRPTDGERRDVGPARELAEHHHLLVGQLDRGDAVWLERL